MSEHQEELRKRLGELVTEAYKAAGYSRESLAPVAGVSSRTLFSMEQGKSIPRVHTQRQLEKALGWRKGAIADVLSLGPDVYVDQINLKDMRPTQGNPWGDEHKDLEADTVLQRLNIAAVDVTVMVREKDRRIEELERQLEEAERRVKQMQDSLGLAADDSPNHGRDLREFLDGVAEHNQTPPQN